MTSKASRAILRAEGVLTQAPGRRSLDAQAKPVEGALEQIRKCYSTDLETSRVLGEVTAKLRRMLEDIDQASW